MLFVLFGSIISRKMELDNNNHSVFLLYYHLVLVVKYRRKVFSDRMSQYAKDIFVRIGSSYNITLEEWNHDQDHVFFDTMIICMLTGLVIASTGVLGMIDPATGKAVSGAQLTIAAFSTVFGDYGKLIVSISISLFAFSTILGWEYYGEKALEYLIKSRKVIMSYRVFFALITFVGATTTLDVVWNFSDTMNGLMIIPNLICLLWLSNDIAKECFEYQELVVEKEKAGEAVDFQPAAEVHVQS